MLLCWLYRPTIMQSIKQNYYVMSLIYCRECGKQVSSSAAVCPHCGFDLRFNDPNKSKKDWLLTLLLCFFLGGFGIHSFYSGKTGIGVVQLLTAGGCGIWWLVDFIMIICGSYRDGEGKIVSNN